MKFNGKCRILHLGQVKPGCMDRLGNEKLESSAMERDLGGVLVDGKLNISQQCPGSQEGQPCSGVHQAKHRQPVKGGDCPALLCAGVASPQVLGDIKLLGSVQRRPMKMVKGLEGKPYEELLRSFGLFSLEKKRLRGHIIAVYNFFVKGRGGAGTDLCGDQWQDQREGPEVVLGEI
ncbi:hypothetical protein DUI87_02150 [Hirundo rustica rustica]|uniref:Uncharacterized protein n=1 Tax=Hirundo rustica rustica TaxID=333673 RepID=A0A3M0L717_HIRRU|nr:hypothetical protein DUI87_02150 [Hirundo rustica rustica]